MHAKDTNFIFGTPHTQYGYTQTNGHTQTHIDTDTVPFSQFALFVPKTQFFLYLAHSCTDTQTDAHTCVDTSTHRYRESPEVRSPCE